MKTIFKKLSQILPFTAGDDTQIREVLHPDNDGQDFGFSLAHASLEPGEASKPHRLQGRSETYVLQQGSGRAWIEGQSYELEAGDTLFIPAGAEQHIENTGREACNFGVSYAHLGRQRRRR